MNLKPSERFSQWVEKVIAEPGAGDCLPTIDELTQRFGLSRTWVKQKLKPYIANGLLTTIRGSGTFVTSRMPRSPEPIRLPTRTSPHSIADALVNDIATGSLKHGNPLPAVKLLCRQFKTGHGTVTRAYRILQEKGLARKVGRKFWVGGMQSLRSFGARKSIVCFNFSEGDPSDLTAGNELGRAYQAMEHELHTHRLNLQFEDCAQLDLFLRPGALAKSDCAGIVISGLTEERFVTLCPRLQALAPAAARLGKRVLLCGAHRKKKRIPKGMHYFAHGTIVTNVVRTAAQSCFVKGFQDIVLLFREREDNLKDNRFLIRFISESLMRNPKARITYLIQPHRPGQTPESIFTRTPAFKKAGTFEYMEGLLSKYEPRTMDDMYRMVKLGDNFDELLAGAPRKAVWLTKEASTAREASNWCDSHRVSVPSEAALLCFDDDLSMCHRGIASCVPDWNTIGYIMAHALIGDIPLEKSRKGFLRTPAVLFERRTLP